MWTVAGRNALAALFVGARQIRCRLLCADAFSVSGNRHTATAEPNCVPLRDVGAVRESYANRAEMRGTRCPGATDERRWAKLSRKWKTPADCGNSANSSSGKRGLNPNGTGSAYPILRKSETRLGTRAVGRGSPGLLPLTSLRNHPELPGERRGSRQLGWLFYAHTYTIRLSIEIDTSNQNFNPSVVK